MTQWSLGYKQAWRNDPEPQCRHDPKCGTTEDYAAGFRDGQADRVIADRLGAGPVDERLVNNTRRGPAPGWSDGHPPSAQEAPQEPQEAVEAVG